MADAGLTNGAFYAHFPSKDDQLREQRASFSERAPGRAGVEQYVREYLSVQHRDNPGDGCPSAALLEEIGRCADATKRVPAGFYPASRSTETIPGAGGSSGSRSRRP